MQGEPGVKSSGVEKKGSKGKEVKSFPHLDVGQ